MGRIGTGTAGVAGAVAVAAIVAAMVCRVFAGTDGGPRWDLVSLGTVAVVGAGLWVHGGSSRRAAPGVVDLGKELGGAVVVPEPPRRVPARADGPVRGLVLGWLMIFGVACYADLAVRHDAVARPSVASVASLAVAPASVAAVGAPRAVAAADGSAGRRARATGEARAGGEERADLARRRSGGGSFLRVGQFGPGASGLLAVGLFAGVWVLYLGALGLRAPAEVGVVRDSLSGGRAPAVRARVVAAVRKEWEEYGPAGEPIVRTARVLRLAGGQGGTSLDLTVLRKEDPALLPRTAVELGGQGGWLAAARTWRRGSGEQTVAFTADDGRVLWGRIPWGQAEEVFGPVGEVPLSATRAVRNYRPAVAAWRTHGVWWGLLVAAWLLLLPVLLLPAGGSGVPTVPLVLASAVALVAAQVTLAVTRNGAADRDPRWVVERRQD